MKWDSIIGGKTLNLITAVKMAEKDILTSHVIPNPKNKYYKIPSLLQKEIREGNFKPLVTDKQLKVMIQQSQANRM